MAEPHRTDNHHTAPDLHGSKMVGEHPSKRPADQNPSTGRSEGVQGRRIQLRHTLVIDLHGRRDTAYDPALNQRVIYIGRRQWWGADRILEAHSLGNPFSVKRYGLHESLVQYADWLLGNPERTAIAKSLHGLTLGCWCLDTLPACHGLVVAAVADGDLGRIGVVLERARSGAK